MNTLLCPCCGSSSVLVYSEQSWWVNSGEHYCNSVKAHDSTAKARCVDCDWAGQRKHLQTKNNSGADDE